MAGTLSSAAAPPAVEPPAGPERPPVAVEGRLFAESADSVLTVSAVVWPDQQALDALPAGATVPLLPVTDIDIDGSSYAVRVDPATLPAKYRSRDGVDVEVTAVDGAGVEDSYSETVRRDGAAWRRSPVVAGLRAQGRTGPAQRPSDLVAVTGDRAGRARAGSVVAAAGRTAAGDERSGIAARDPICNVIKTSKTHHRRVKIGDVMPSKRRMKGRITYRIGSSHNIGVGIKMANGRYREGGTVRRSSSEQVSPVFWRPDKVAWTKWRYRNYQNTCTQAISARAEAHTGGYYKTDRSRPSYRYCRSYPRGRWAASSARAWTYQKGATLWGVLHVNAQTGYNNHVRLEYKLGRRKTLCGNNDYPPGAQLVAGR
ncbi:hypothetical protein [Nocardioides donggukensis]|uniref:Uncharacterized protein n=1 Tax=Nocardioides donggukensis TaxID=2774019 RepID=A0A927K4D6_9ACTN|nr:hypothetical protein [Nocardioides donggukensis]MBD8869902.1 hypothetical protein [Nocardioides donggukensis]